MKTVQFVSPRNGQLCDGVSTLRVMTLSEMTLWVLTFSIMALGIMTLIKMTNKKCHAAEHFRGYLESLDPYMMKRKKPTGRHNALVAILGIFLDQNSSNSAMTNAA